jgi:CheY-like chemotaxis protein
METMREEMPGGETILLAEDQDVMRTLARRSLEKWGYRVLVAAHGAEALALARAHEGPIHLLLTDLAMPQMDGVELAGELTRLRPGTRVIVMSAHVDQARVDQVQSVPGAAFLAKPFAMDALARTIRELLDAEPS